jgi:type I restriction enzyme S subunit
MHEATTFMKYIPFENLNLWDVKRYNSKTGLQFENKITLRELLKPYKHPVSKEEMIKNKWQIISKINFGGELFLRDFDEISNYKGSLNLVPENAIIYSKINVRHGCIYFNEKGNSPFGVSTEYPIFTFDESKINGKFLQKVLRSSTFKKLLNSKTTGISKARVKQDEFLDIEIPLPSIEEQEKIVNNYYSKIKDIIDLEMQVNDLEGKIEKYFLKQLGLDIKNDQLNQNKKGLNFIEFKNLNRWDGENENDIKSHFEIEKIGKFILDISTGTTPPTNRKEYFNGEVNFYTPIELGNEMYLNNSRRKITDFAIQNKKARRFDKGTLLFVGIGSTIGKIGIIDNEYASSNQQITGFKVDNTYLLNEFVYFYFQYFKNITIKDYTKATLPIINQEKILKIPIPIPPIKKQQEIIQQITYFRNEIDSNKVEIDKKRQNAKQEFENEIFKLK